MILLFVQGWVKWRSGSLLGCGSHSKSQRQACKSTAKKPLMGYFPAWRRESVHAYKSQIKVIKAHWSLATSTAAPWVYFWVLVYSSEMIRWYAGGLTVIWARGSLVWARMGSIKTKEKKWMSFCFCFIRKAVEILVLWKECCFSVFRIQILRRSCKECLIFWFIF